MPSTSKYDFVCDRKLFLVRVREASREAVLAIELEFNRRFEEVGEPLFYIALVGPEAETPDAATREAMFDAFARSFDKMAMVRVVMFGSGAKLTILRSLTTALMLALGMTGRRMYVDKNLRVAAEVLAATLGYDPDGLITRAVSEGLLTREEAG